MASYTKFHCSTEDMLRGKHDFGTHVFKVMLTNVAPNVVTNTILADLTEITIENGYPAGGFTMDNVTLSRALNVTDVLMDDEVFTSELTGTVGPFRYPTLYNATTVGGPLLGYWDYGESSSLNPGENLVLDFDGANGALSLA